MLLNRGFNGFGMAHTSGDLTPPDGFAFVVDEDGNYVVDGNGAYVIVPAAPMGFELVRQANVIVTHLGHPVYVTEE